MAATAAEATAATEPAKAATKAAEAVATAKAAEAAGASATLVAAAKAAEAAVTRLGVVKRVVQRPVEAGRSGVGGWRAYRWSVGPPHARNPWRLRRRPALNPRSLRIR